jgi:hypothetical protein
MTENCLQSYEKLDWLITESMLCTERKTAHMVSSKYDWSPTLAQANHSVRFWDMCCRKSLGIKFPDRVLTNAAGKARIDPSLLPTPLTYTAIMSFRREARSLCNLYLFLGSDPVWSTRGSKQPVTYLVK